MNRPRPLLGSLTRISDLATEPYEIAPLPRDQWDTADYVAGEVIDSGGQSARLELPEGREIPVLMSDTVVGALGIRAATLEAAGHWDAVAPDNVLDVMTAAGLLGRITSKSFFVGAPIRLQYLGHVLRRGHKVRMNDFRPIAPAASPFPCPTILVIGTSMSSGKTMSARVIVRLLKRLDLRVVGTKLTGAGRYRDILSLHDAGADAVFDFVDAGLPSTVCPESQYRAALDDLLGQIAAAAPDVVVAEAGASPLEPYNGKLAVECLEPHVCCTILCASDPYAVVGVTRGFGFDPDLVAGVATSTSAGCQVIERLTGLRAINVHDPAEHAALEELLRECLPN